MDWLLPEVTISGLASLSTNRGFPAAVTETLCIFRNTCRKNLNSETSEELPVPSSCRCVSRAHVSPVLDFRYSLGQLRLLLLSDASLSALLIPSPKILGFSSCSLSAHLERWHLFLQFTPLGCLNFFFFTFSLVNNFIPSLTFFVNSLSWNYRYASVSSMDFNWYRCFKLMSEWGCHSRR